VTLPRLPRDTLVLSDAPEVLTVAARRGYPTCDVRGRDADWLAAHWSRLSRRNPSAMLILRDDVPALRDVVARGCARAAVNGQTGATRSRAWVTGILAQARLLLHYPPAQALAGQLRGIPAFVVGAGPSLSHTAFAANRARRHGVVVSVNAASRLVDGQCVLTVEANNMCAKVMPRDSVRLFVLGCHPALLEHGAGPLMPLWCGEVSGPLESLTGLPRVACSASGSTAAVSLAYAWGCDPIVLVGQDLAWTGGRVYADTDDRVRSDGRCDWSVAARAQHRHAPLPESYELHAVPGWGGGPDVQTSDGFDVVASWLSSASGLVRSRLLNATGGGRHIPGWQDVPLDEVLASLPVRSLTPADIERASGDPIVCAAELDAWLGTAPDAFLEPYALPDVLALLREHRSRPPYRMPWREARAVRTLCGSIDTVAARCRRDLETLCSDTRHTRSQT